MSKKYGSAILEVIRDYCDENDIQTESEDTIFDDAESKDSKENTRDLSLQLFQSGKSVAEIATSRDLNENTIFGHLAGFISTGEIKITDLMSKETYDTLLKLIPKKTFDNLSDLKHQLDDAYSYGELRIVLDALNN
ncbi:helix-turn-helix domain-containing protein [Formosa algae]|uniref:helix-turn-helix domain-containing protein n=1 Tax=Formosa algae TaxID=225843 RepID=UPI00269F7D38|nr:helix-turn-helix domain-containing protein [Formosa algae]